VRVPYLYAHPVNALIHALKFRRRLAAASVLGRLLTDHLKDSGICAPQWILPVPLHPKRQRERGFNQSLEIARPLSACLKVRIAPTLARRTLPTVAQSSLQGADSRRRNVSSAFSVDTRRAQPADHVAIVDDVVTTGATVTSLALALKSAGVTRIEVWSIARATEP
jgi:ComF family protein